MPKELVSVPNKLPKSVAKRVKHLAAIDKAELYLAKNLPEMTNLLLELARGVIVMEEDKDTGQPRVYAKPPDFKALSFLVDRVMGKTPQRLELTGKDGGPQEFVAWAAPDMEQFVKDEDTIEGELVND